jgi:hypothetical protein
VRTNLSVYTRIQNSCMGRPPKPEAERRSVLFPLRLTPGEMALFEDAARKLGETVADLLRKGAMSRISKGKGGLTQRKGKK